MKTPGKVFLVGAGPGAPGLLTVRGAELLRQADVVVYDALVNPELLRLAPPHAEILFGGKRSKKHALTQEQINALLQARARAGKTVVRLKGGDPYMFGRGGEEAEALADAGIPFEVVPGVSSFVAVPTYAGVPVTHREHSSKLTILTGHVDPVTGESRVNWEQVAKEPGTKVIMMGTEHIGHIATRLMAGGMSPETPVLMVRWGTLPRQESVEGTLANIATVAAASGIAPPTVIVVGDVVKLRPKLNWFERLPLFGRRIVVTRPREQAGQLARPLAERGAEVLEIPTIKMEPPTRKEDVADALLELNAYDWIVFTSPNGVTAFFEHFDKVFEDARDIGGVRIAAVGPATAAKVREFRLKVDVMPKEALAARIAAAMARYESLENLKILLARAEVATPDLPRALTERGAIVDDVAFYKTMPDTSDVSGDAARLLQSGADWITFTSGSTVTHFHERFNLPGLLQKFPQVRLATIGPETTRALVALGLAAHVEARPHTIAGLVSALVRAARRE